MSNNVKEFPERNKSIIPLYLKSMEDDLDHRPNIITMLGGTIGEDCVSKDTSVCGLLVKSEVKKGSLATILKKNEDSISYTPSLMEPVEDCEGYVYVSIEEAKKLYEEHFQFEPAIYDYQEDGPRLRLISNELSIGIDVNMGTWEVLFSNDPASVIALITGEKIIGVVIETGLVVESNIIETSELISFNHETGMATPVSSAGAHINVNVTDVTEEMVNEDDRLKQAAKENLGEYGLTDEEVIQMIHVMERYRNKENFSVFNALPVKMQTIIKREASAAGACNQAQINWFAKELLETFITEMKVDKAWIELEESIKKELAIPDLMDMYSDYIRSMMEENLLQKANEIEASAPDKAEKLREISAAFKDTYTLSRVIQAFETNARVTRRLDEGIAKYNRICDDFIYKFKDSKFVVGDISKIPFVLSHRFPTYGDDMYKAFVAVLWSTFENTDINNMADMSYVYFTIKNILVLDFVGEDKTEFSKHLIENIMKIFELIKKALQEREERKNVSKKRNKRNK